MNNPNTKANRIKQFKRGFKDGNTFDCTFGQNNELGTEGMALNRAYEKGWRKARGEKVPGPQFRTNNRAYTLKMYSELTEKERKELDYVKCDTNSFFRHNGQVYDLSEFARIIAPEAMASHRGPFTMEMLDHNGDFDDWDCYAGDSYFSGLVVRYKRMPDEPDEFDPERIVIGVYTV